MPLNTAQRLLVRRRSEPKELSPDEEGGEINLVPYLDIVINVIMFLILTVTVALALARMDVSAPRYGAGAGAGAQGPQLNLTINLTQSGFTVAGAGGLVTADCRNIGGTPPTVPLKQGQVHLAQGANVAGCVQRHGPQPMCMDYSSCPIDTTRTGPAYPCLEHDFEGLTQCLVNVKSQFPTERRAILSPNQDAPYDYVIRTMDACRFDPQQRELFPEVVLSAGVQ